VQVVILAGGLGTRIREISGDLPKALVPIKGIPFVYYQLHRLAAEGVDDVVLSLGYKAEMIRTAVGDGRRFGLRVSYADEGNRLRGTAGAIRYAADLGLIQEAFFVLYGDSYLPIEIPPVWEASHRGRLLLMTVMRNVGKWDKSNVRYEPGRPLLYDKRCSDPSLAGMDYIDYGLMVLRKDFVLNSVPADTIADLADIMGAASAVGDVEGYPVSERFYEIGSPQGIRDFEDYVTANPAATPDILHGAQKYGRRSDL
jgi:NDP-sugar pyrophosphorylase family protein